MMKLIIVGDKRFACMDDPTYAIISDNLGTWNRSSTRAQFDNLGSCRGHHEIHLAGVSPKWLNSFLENHKIVGLTCRIAPIALAQNVVHHVRGREIRFDP